MALKPNSDALSFFPAMEIAGKERAPQAPWSAATWRRLQLVPCPVPRRRRAAVLQGASRIFMHCGGSTAHDIFAQDDGPFECRGIYEAPYRRSVETVATRV
jgi:hypothetical protein